MLEHTSRLYHLFKGQLSLLAFQGFGQGLGFFFMLAQMGWASGLSGVWGFAYIYIYISGFSDLKVFGF